MDRDTASTTLPGPNAFHPERMGRPIVVGVDGSPGSAAAVRWCAAYAGVLVVDVVAVHVVDLVAVVGPYAAFVTADLYDETWRKALVDEMRAVWCQPLADRRVPFDCRVEDGPAASVLADVADSLDAQLVVVGRQGAGRVAEMLLGSVPHRLAHRCDRPLVIVPEEGVS